MNIAIFTETYTPQINGVVVSIETFRNEMEKLGHRVYIIAPRFHKKTVDHPRVCRVFSIPYPWKSMREQRYCIPFPWDVQGFRSLKIDIIHAQVTSSNTAYFALLVGRYFHIPVVHTYHTLFIEYVHYMPLPRDIARIGVKLLSRHYCNSCVRNVAPSSRVAKELRSYGVKKPLDIIPTGMDQSLSQNAIPFDRGKYNIPEEKILLTFIGRLAKEKNIPFLFDVLRLLLSGNSDVHLILVGDGPERRNLEIEAKQKNIFSRITFTGYLSRGEVLGILQSSKIFTSCSMTETQGIVVLEALSCGVPVVAIDAMGIEDILDDGKGGILVSPNPDEFANQVLRFLQEPVLWEKTSNEALAKGALWNSDTMAARLIECYKMALKEYRKPR